MKLDLSNVQLQIPCPKCGEKIPETIGRLKNDPNLTCDCGAAIHVDSTQLEQGIKAVEEKLNSFGRNLRNRFK